MPETDNASQSTAPTIESLTALLEAEKAHSRKWEERAKANKEKADSLAEVEQARDDALAALEKARSRASEVEADAATSTALAVRYRAAATHGITVGDADLFLTGTDEDTIMKQAERFAERQAPSGRAPAPNDKQGNRGNSGPRTASDAFGDFLAEALGDAG